MSLLVVVLVVVMLVMADYHHCQQGRQGERAIWRQEDASGRTVGTGHSTSSKSTNTCLLALLELQHQAKRA